MGKPDRDIQQIFILVSESPDGKEGIIMTQPLPFVTSSEAIAVALFEKMRKQYSEQARENNLKIKLMKFSNKELIDEVK